LISDGYSILDIKRMKMSDFELMVKAMEVKKEEIEKETTLDKAFPFLFG
jgi:hypothetical protein